MHAPPTIASFAYHEVTDDPRTSGFQRPGARPYTYSRTAFAGHLDAIAAGGLAPELVVDVDLALPGPHLLLTFDDGGRSALYVADELARRGWKAHFFIVTALLGARTFLRPADVRSLRGAGHLIGSHSHTHPDIFRNLSRPRMLEEWRQSCDTLAMLLGEPCVMAAVPGGDISRMVLDAADEARLRYLFTSEPLLRPERRGDCWILGRLCFKAGVPPTRVRELVALRGWRRAQVERRLKDLARRGLGPLYRLYVQRITQ